MNTVNEVCTCDQQCVGVFDAFTSPFLFPSYLSSQGATWTAGRHLPAAEREQGDIWGGVGGRHGGAAQTLLHLRLFSDSMCCDPAFDLWALLKDYSSTPNTSINLFTVFNTAVQSTQQLCVLIWHNLLLCHIYLSAVRRLNQSSWLFPAKSRMF